MVVTKFNLSWHNYTDHLREMLHGMMTSNEFTDVTLVSEDKKQFKAHKVVLSASSPFFKNIFNLNLFSNSIIYLRGIQSDELESIIQYIYLGQATFCEDRTNEFFNVAKSLEIKEISNENPGKQTSECTAEDQAMEKSDLPQINEIVGNYDFEQSNDQLESEKKTNFRANNVVIKENQIKPMNQQDSKFICDQCEKRYKTKDALLRHIASAHVGIKYPCNKCSHKASQARSLNQHIKSVHEGALFPCDKCNFRSKSSSYLYQHVRSMHEGVKYP